MEGWCQGRRRFARGEASILIPLPKNRLSFSTIIYKPTLSKRLHFTKPPEAPSGPEKTPREEERGIARLFNLLLLATRQMVTPSAY